MKNNVSIILLFCFSLILIAQGCKKEEDKLPLSGSIDAEMFKFTKETGFGWYKRQDRFFAISSNSSHEEDFFKTKYNSISRSMLNLDGKVMDNAIFPDGSVIIKQLYSDIKTLSTYAIMYKKSDSEYADDDGWVWGYYSSSGEVRESAENKGIECRSCHLQSGNIDLTLMNKVHP